MHRSKKFVSVVFVVGMVFGVAVNKCSGADLYVPGSFTTIQSAINAAITGDTVWVADGTWTGTGNKNWVWLLLDNAQKT